MENSSSISLICTLIWKQCVISSFSVSLSKFLRIHGPPLLATCLCPCSSLSRTKEQWWNTISAAGPNVSHIRGRYFAGWTNGPFVPAQSTQSGLFITPFGSWCPETVLLWLDRPVTNRTRDRCDMRTAKVPYVSLFYPYFNWKRPSDETHVSTSDSFNWRAHFGQASIDEEQSLPLSGNLTAIMHGREGIRLHYRPTLWRTPLTSVRCVRLSARETRFHEIELCRKPSHEVASGCTALGPTEGRVTTWKIFGKMRKWRNWNAMAALFGGTEKNNERLGSAWPKSRRKFESSIHNEWRILGCYAVWLL
jgi:hypothetical protein